jgi:hypothetical protein
VRIRLLVVAFLLLINWVPVFAKKKSTPLPVPPHSTTSREYVLALNSANRFLQAWQVEDHEAGLMMLTDSAKHATSPEKLESYFSPETATQRAYEVARGRKIKAGRYTFPVTFFEQGAGTPRVRNSQIMVVQTGKDEWAVDKLP